MYQVLYRKYRPKTFDDVCGQKVIVKLLKNSINNNKISHAYLFAGPRGTGKTSMAKIFARIVNCENPIDLTPCGKCVNCTQNTNDVIEIDAASNNGVDEIRELRNKVNLVPTSGKYKVYIIDEVHMLTTGAFNALLKTLEEPPAHVIFILATTDPHKIPETILSRCQRLDFKKITIEEIISKLKEISQKESIEANDAVLKEIAILSDGGLRDSISLLDEASIFSDNNITIEDIHTINGTLTSQKLLSFVNDLIKCDYLSLFDNIDKYNSEGKNYIKLTEEIINILKDILLYKVVPDYFPEINCEREDINLISQEITKEKVIEYIHEFNNCLSEMAKTNNHKLLFELSIIKLINNFNEEPSKLVNKEEKSIEKEIKTDKTLKPRENIKPHVTPPSSNLKEDKGPVENHKKTEQTETVVENFEEDENISQADEELLKHLRNVRIGNTLSKFNKKLLPELKKQLENITGFLLDPTYSQYVSIIMDGSLKASSDENIIFVFNKKHISDDFNMNLLVVEELIERLFGKHYNVISTWFDDWEIIKDDFNNKKKEFKYQKEDFDLKEILSSNGNDEIGNLFGDIIEYS